MKFDRYEKGGGKCFSHAEGGHKKFWGCFYVVACSFSHTEGKVSFFKRGGGAKSFTLS